MKTIDFTDTGGGNRAPLLYASENYVFENKLFLGEFKQLFIKKNKRFV